MKKKAFLAIILCGLLAGSNGLLVKAMTTLTPSSIAWYRTAIPTIILGLWVFFSGRNLFRGNNKTMLFASGINALRLYLYLVAFIYTSIGNAVIISYTWPIFVAIFSAIYLKEKINRAQISLLLLAFAGLIVAYSEKTFTLADRDMIGMLAALGTAFFYAMTVVIYKKEAVNYHRWELIVFQNLVGGLVFLPAMFMNFESAVLPDIGLAFVYAIFVGIGIFGLFFFALKYLNATTVSGVMYLEVVSAIVLGALVLNEQLSPVMIIGGIMILTSSFLMNRLHKK